MKKLTSHISVLIAVIFVFENCTKNVNEKPLSIGTIEEFYKNKYDADAAISGMYGEFQQEMVGDAQFKNRYTFWGEGRSDNFERSQYSNNSTNEMHFNSLTPNNDFTTWAGLYRVIGRANLNIQKFPLINNFAPTASRIDDPTLNSYMAQCYSMRALCYFYIVRLWGDAPLRTQPYLDLNAPSVQARDPQAKILDTAISDLQKAYSLSAKGATSVVWYINEGTICAILADIYMWKHDYDNAIKWIQLEFKAKGPTGKVYNPSAGAAVGSGGAATDLEATATWKNQFTNPPGSVESLWNIHWDYTSNGCACMAGVSTAVNNTPYIVAIEIFNGSWANDTADIRAKSTFDVTKKERDRVWKWYPGNFGPNGPKGNYTGTSGTTLNVYLPMYRLADQFLLYAEALNQKGDLTNALKYLNLVHVRAGLKPYTAGQFADMASMENAILQERQWELFGEGKRWFDLVRTDHVNQVMDPILKTRQRAQSSDTVGFGSDKRRYLWPLHRNVLNANNLLIQNPPYTD